MEHGSDASPGQAEGGRLRVVEEVAHEVRETPDLGPEEARELLALLRVREQALVGVERRGDAEERRAHLVGDAGDERPHRGEGLAPLQRRLQPVPLADVADGGHAQRAPRHVEGAPLHLDEEGRPVLADRAVLVGGDGPSLQALLDLRLVHRRDEVRHRAAQELGDRVAEHGRELVVRVHHPAVLGEADPLERGLRDPSQALLAVEQGQAGLPCAP